MKNYVSFHLDGEDLVEASYRSVHLLEGPPVLEVFVGTALTLWGSPNVVLGALCEALVRAYQATVRETNSVIADRRIHTAVCLLAAVEEGEE